MRRINERSMTRIEEVDEEDDEEIVDLIEMFREWGKALRENGEDNRSSSVRHKPRR